MLKRVFFVLSFMLTLSVSTVAMAEDTKPAEAAAPAAVDARPAEAAPAAEPAKPAEATTPVAAPVEAAAPPAAAAPPPPNKGDTAWMIVATLLVIMMAIPGLALFYGGMVRTKNMLNMLLKVFATFSLL